MKEENPMFTWTPIAGGARAGNDRYTLHVQPDLINSRPDCTMWKAAVYDQEYTLLRHCGAFHTMGDAKSYAEGQAAELARSMTAEERLAVLRGILFDPVNQLEVTKGGYYIYRFSLETMHEIADAIGVPPSSEPFATYTPEELTRLIRE